MSTSYFVYCETCKKAVTDQNDCDNHPEIPLCIVENIIAYTHLAMMLEELPVPRTSWLDYEVKLSGFRIDLSDIRKHCTHQLAVYDEYGTVYPRPNCKVCNSQYCPNIKHLGESHYSVCCDKCTHREPS